MSGPGLNVPLDDPRLPALKLVRPPAFLLLCVGILNILICLVVLAAMLFGVQVLPTASEAAAAQQEPVTWPVLLTALGAIVSGALTVWGALSAFNLRSWGLVVVGAITAIFPLTPTCCLGLPFAAWMLWVLNMPEVKRHFS
ncbi:MAG TPA: hypothetical protein VLQ93_11890 [Myxococcaceae bacterium]|nr:hypothetical protein [Myxococcaceae bacterium]